MCNPLSAQIFRHFREAQSSIWPISLLVADSRSAFDSAAHIYGGEATNFTLPAAIPAYSLVHLGSDLVLARLTFNGIFSECFIPSTIDTSKRQKAPVGLCVCHKRLLAPGDMERLPFEAYADSLVKQALQSHTGCIG
jgi:hypothetical protein